MTSCLSDQSITGTLLVGYMVGILDLSTTGNFSWLDSLQASTQASQPMHLRRSRRVARWPSLAA